MYHASITIFWPCSARARARAKGKGNRVIDGFSDLKVGKAFEILVLDYVFLLSTVAVVYFLFSFRKSM